MNTLKTALVRKTLSGESTERLALYHVCKLLRESLEVNKWTHFKGNWSLSISFQMGQFNGFILCLHVWDGERGGKCDPFRPVGFERQCRGLYTSRSLPSKQIDITVNKEFLSSN